MILIGHNKTSQYQILAANPNTIIASQAQYICFFRSLCRRPSLLLLNEATSDLDPETEASIVSTLQRLSGIMYMTIISVTHRLSTSLNAD